MITTNENSEVKSIVNRDSFSVLIDGNILCSMSSGGCHFFRTELQAEVAGRNYVRGYTGGSYLSSDVDNFVSEQK